MESFRTSNIRDSMSAHPVTFGLLESTFVSLSISSVTSVVNYARFRYTLLLNENDISNKTHDWKFSLKLLTTNPVSTWSTNCPNHLIEGKGKPTAEVCTTSRCIRLKSRTSSTAGNEHLLPVLSCVFYWADTLMSIQETLNLYCLSCVPFKCNNDVPRTSLGVQHVTSFVWFLTMIFMKSSSFIKIEESLNLSLGIRQYSKTTCFDLSMLETKSYYTHIAKGFRSGQYMV